MCDKFPKGHDHAPDNPQIAAAFCRWYGSSIYGKIANLIISNISIFQEATNDGSLYSVPDSDQMIEHNFRKQFYRPWVIRSEILLKE